MSNERPGTASDDPGLGLALQFERELDAQAADVARALRDDIGPQLSALRTLAASLESRLDSREPALASLAAVLLGQADSLIASVRALAARVRPDALSCGGLPEALQALAADWRLRRPGCRVEVLIDPADDAGFGLASPVIETAALQVAVAACERALATGQSGALVMAASCIGAELLLQIEFDRPESFARRDAEVPSWFSGARARVVALGGEAGVERAEGGGTAIVVRLPWRSV